MDPLEHVCYKLRNARVKLYPFPHFFIRNVFPRDFYMKLVENLPPDDRYKANESSYRNRYFGPKDYDPTGFLGERQFLDSVLAIFGPQLFERKNRDYLPGESMSVSTDIRLIRDVKGYKIGPHTDAPWKMVSLLFYLPKNPLMRHAGTSIFVPEDHEKRCNGGPHYPFDGFRIVDTAPFIPNSCFGFWKTDYSWHGVEPLDIEGNRDILLYNIYARKK